MNDNKKRILEMLSEGKISVDEADRLLSLVEEPGDDLPDPLPPATSRNGPGKYLRVDVVDGDERVNIRVPLSLIRGGVKLGALFTTGPSSKINERLKEKGIDLDELSGSDGLDALVNGLGELEIDVQDGSREHVRIYAE